MFRFCLHGANAHIKAFLIDDALCKRTHIDNDIVIW